MKFLARGVGWLIRAVAVILAVYGFVVGMTAAQGLSGLGGLVFVLAGWFPVVFIHELGHAVAARLVGWRTAIFHIAPFTLRLRPLALRLDGDLGGPDIAGFVLPVPRNLKHDTWRRSAWISAGGPIASWLLVAVCLYLAGVDSRGPHSIADRPSISWDQALSPSPPTLSGLRSDNEEHLRMLAIAFTAYSLMIALGSSWPALRRSGWTNDAWNVASLLKRRPVSPSLKGAAGLASLLHKYDVPARAFEPWLIEALNRDAARRKMFADFVDALRAHDESAMRTTAERLAADSKLSESVVAQGFVAAWLDSDIARADDCLCSAGAMSDDVLIVRHLALAMVFRLEGDLAGVVRALQAIPRTEPPWNRLAQQALTAPLKAGAE